MAARRLAFLALAAVAACASDPRTSTTGAEFPSPPPAPVHHGRAAGDAFDAKLLGAFASHHGNFVYSPASLGLVLETVRQGAAGATAAEMDEVLGPSAAALAKATRELEPLVSIANGVFVDRSAPLESAFSDAASRDFGARIETVDFHDHPDASRLRINRWVSEQTRDRVRDLLGAGVVVRDTKMVVVDAIHMKASWQTAFPIGATKPDVFHLGDGTTKNVETMHGRVTATLGEHAGARVLDLPYVPARSGAALALVLLVPENGKLAALESDYRREGLAPFADAASRPGRIEVSLPRFRVSSSNELGETLRALGLRRAFTDQADFSGISSSGKLALSTIVQQANVEVDETGTEASAASTGGTVEITSARIEKPLSFRVDRPFLFVIRDRATGTVLFTGRVEDPG